MRQTSKDRFLSSCAAHASSVSGPEMTWQLSGRGMSTNVACFGVKRRRTLKHA